MYSHLLPTVPESATPTELEPLQSPTSPPSTVQASSPISPLQPAGSSAVTSRVLSPSPGAGSPHCRYCLGRNQSLNYSEDRESLIGPCRCKGTVGLVHPGCLMRWLQISRKHRCELCGFDLRQSDRLALLPQLAAAAADNSEATGARSPSADDAAAAAAADAAVPPPAGWSQWLRRPEQTCCTAMTICCLLFVVPLIGVLIYFVSELRRQTDGSGEGAQDYQVVLFELLTGFVTVVVLVWLIYGSVTCASRYRAWRLALRRQREATTIVSLEGAAA